MPLLTELIDATLAARAARVDYLIALGTHQPMSEQRRIDYLGPVGAGAINHAWDNQDTFVTVGELSADEVTRLSGGLLRTPIPIRLNRLVADADLVLVCGPVFPHEVVGFSGGNKYFFPGVASPEIIDATHWLGALLTSRDLIGRSGTTPVRAVIDAAAARIPTERRCLAMVVDPVSGGLHGIYGGTPEAAWAAAAELSAQVHIRWEPRPYRRVLAVMSEQYDDMWTAAKGMYKTEPVVADGGEVVIYAPHIDSISVTHQEELSRIGYHVRDYFLGQWGRFGTVPGTILAHSTHLRGAGTWSAGAGEQPRVQVTLATAIPPEVCRELGVGYRDPATIDVEVWRREAEHDPDLLVVAKAGEMLYRLAADRP